MLLGNKLWEGGWREGLGSCEEMVHVRNRLQVALLDLLLLLQWPVLRGMLGVALATNVGCNLPQMIIGTMRGFVSHPTATLGVCGLVQKATR